MSVKISELPILDSLADNDVLAGVDTSENATKKIELATLKDYIDTNTTYTAGTNIDITNNVVSAPNVYNKDEMDSQIEELQSEVDSLNTIYNAFPTVSDEDESMTLDGTAETKFKNIDLKGNTSQYTTTGKNLLNATSSGSHQTGLYVTRNSDGSYTLNGTNTGSQTEYTRLCPNFTLPAGTYTLSNGNSNVSNAGFIFYDDRDNFGRTENSTKTFSNSVEIAPYIKVGAGVTVNNQTIYPMIESGSSKTDYEPYTGGKASPNPDYPQDIHVVSGDNSVVVRGKNLWEDSKGYNLYLLSYNNGVYSASDNDNRSSLQYKLQQYDSSGSVISGSGFSKTINAVGVYYFTLTRVANAKSFRISNNGQSTEFRLFYPLPDFIKVGEKYTVAINIIDKTIGASKFKDVMLMQGEISDTTYVPFQGIATYPINLPVENLLDLSVAPIYKDGANSSFVEPKIDISKTTSYANVFCVFSIGNANELNGKNIKLTGQCLASGTTKGNCALGYLDANGSNRVVVANTGPIGNSNVSINMTVDATTYPNKKVALWLYGDSSQAGSAGDTITYENIMVSTSNSKGYTPYGTTPIELCKIGDYTDYFLHDKTLDKWYLHKEIGKVVLNGSENWQLRNTSEKGTKTYSLGNVLNDYLLEPSVTNPGGYALCDKFVVNRTVTGIGQMYSPSNLLDVIGLDFYYNQSSPTARAIYTNTTENLPIYLSSNNATIYYQLATPTDTEITYQPLIEQLNAIEKAMSYNSQTNISQVNNDAPFIISAEAIMSLQNVLDRIELLES